MAITRSSEGTPKKPPSRSASAAASPSPKKGSSTTGRAKAVRDAAAALRGAEKKVGGRGGGSGGSGVDDGDAMEGIEVEVPNTSSRSTRSKSSIAQARLDSVLPTTPSRGGSSSAAAVPSGKKDRSKDQPAGGGDADLDETGDGSSKPKKKDDADADAKKNKGGKGKGKASESDLSSADAGPGAGSVAGGGLGNGDAAGGTGGRSASASASASAVKGKGKGKGKDVKVSFDPALEVNKEEIPVPPIENPLGSPNPGEGEGDHDDDDEGEAGPKDIGDGDGDIGKSKTATGYAKAWQRELPIGTVVKVGCGNYFMYPEVVWEPYMVDENGKEVVKIGKGKGNAEKKDEKEGEGTASSSTSTDPAPPSTTGEKPNPNPKLARPSMAGPGNRRIRQKKIKRPHQYYRLVKLLGTGNAKVYEGRPITRLRLKKTVDEHGEAAVELPEDPRYADVGIEADAGGEEEEYAWVWMEIVGGKSVALKMWDMGEHKDELEAEYQKNREVWTELAEKGIFNLVVPALGKGPVIFSEPGAVDGRWQSGRWRAIIYPLFECFRTLIDATDDKHHDQRLRNLSYQAALTVTRFNKHFVHRDVKAANMVVHADHETGEEVIMLIDLVSVRDLNDRLEEHGPIGTYSHVSPSMAAHFASVWMEEHVGDYDSWPGEKRVAWDRIRGDLEHKLHDHFGRDIDLWSLGVEVLDFLDPEWMQAHYNIDEKLRHLRVVLDRHPVDFEDLKQAMTEIGYRWSRVCIQRGYKRRVPKEWLDVLELCLLPSFSSGFWGCEVDDRDVEVIEAAQALAKIEVGRRPTVDYEHPESTVDEAEQCDPEWVPEEVEIYGGLVLLFKIAGSNKFECVQHCYYKSGRIVYACIHRKDREGLTIGTYRWSCEIEDCASANRRFLYARIGAHWDTNSRAQTCNWFEQNPGFLGTRLELEEVEADYICMDE